MIKFFRKIRQKLLTENKFSKYLIYAVGEIVLVVIGIFIAIQLNNLNEERKLQSKENEYYCKLLEDVQQDLIQIERLIIESEKRVKSSNEMLSLLQKDTLNPDQISDKILESNSLVTYTFKPNKAAFEDIKSSGNLAILKDENIKSRILDYYTIVEGIVDVVDINADRQVNEFFNKPNYAQFGWQKIKFIDEAIDSTIVNKSKLHSLIILDENYRSKMTSDAVYFIGSSARIKMHYTLLKAEILKMEEELENKCEK